MQVLVTGGSSGIGRAIAAAALRAGYSVHLVARDEARMRATAAELQRLGQVSYSKLDLADAAATLDFCRTWRAEIHGLVNNAGYWLQDPVAELDPDVFANMLSVNLIAPYILGKGLLRRIRRGGRIINIASQLGTAGRARMGAYSATKHALVGLTKCWAPELGPIEITVNAVCPGWVNTQSNRKELAALATVNGTTLQDEMGAIATDLALQRFIEPHEVAELVAFLLSKAASGITGQIYEIK